MKKQLQFILVGFVLFLLSCELGPAANLGDNARYDAGAIQSCSAKTGDCDVGNRWELFKQTKVDDYFKQDTKSMQDRWESGKQEKQVEVQKDN